MHACAVQVRFQILYNVISQKKTHADFHGGLFVDLSILKVNSRLAVLNTKSFELLLFLTDNTMTRTITAATIALIITVVRDAITVERSEQPNTPK